MIKKTALTVATGVNMVAGGVGGTARIGTAGLVAYSAGYETAPREHLVIAQPEGQIKVTQGTLRFRNYVNKYNEEELKALINEQHGIPKSTKPKED